MTLTTAELEIATDAVLPPQALLLEQHPDRYEAGQLRTLRRRVRRWRAAAGPDREIAEVARRKSLCGPLPTTSCENAGVPGIPRGTRLPPR